MKDLEKLIWDDQMISPFAPPHSRTLPKLLACLFFFASLSYILYTLKHVSSSCVCHDGPFSTNRLSSLSSSFPNFTINTFPSVNATASSILVPIPNPMSAIQISKSPQIHNQMELRHMVFDIDTSSKLWEQRKNYIKLWYNYRKIRGVVWLDDHVETHENDSLPPVRISNDTSNFTFTKPQGHQSAIRISRIVSEMLHLGMRDVTTINFTKLEAYRRVTCRTYSSCTEWPTVEEDLLSATPWPKPF